jgi:lysozyme
MQFNYGNSANYLAGGAQVANTYLDTYDTSQKTGTDVNKLVQAQSKRRTQQRKNAIDQVTTVGDAAVDIQTGMKITDMDSKLKKDIAKIQKPAKMAGALAATVNLGNTGLMLHQDMKRTAAENAESKRLREGAALRAEERTKSLMEKNEELMKLIQKGASATQTPSTITDGPTSSLDLSSSTKPASTSTSGSKSPGWAKWSKLIKTGEGTLGDKGYTTMFTGAQFSDLSKHPAQINVSGKHRSDAAGAYQFLSTTYNPAAAKLGITDFSRESQEKVGKYLAQQRGLDVDKVHTTKESFLKALDKLAPEWASMPTLKTGTSIYGQGGLTPDEAWSIYNN